MNGNSAALLVIAGSLALNVWCGGATANKLPALRWESDACVEEPKAKVRL